MLAISKAILLVAVIVALNIVATTGKSISFNTAQNSQFEAKHHQNQNDKVIAPRDDSTTTPKAKSDDDDKKKLSVLDWVWISLGILAALIILSCLVAYLFCACVKEILCLPCTCVRKCCC